MVDPGGSEINELSTSNRVAAPRVTLPWVAMARQAPLSVRLRETAWAVARFDFASPASCPPSSPRSCGATAATKVIGHGRV